MPLPYQGRIVNHPQFIQLEDRASPGTWWTLIHRASDERFGISDVPLTGFKAYNVRRYAAYNEPLIRDKPAVRFFVRGGRVGYEVDEPDNPIRDRDQAPITTRVGNTKLNLQVLSAGWRREGDLLGYGVLRND